MDREQVGMDRFVQFDVRNHVVRRLPLQYIMRWLVKFTPAEGRVTVRALREGGMLRLEVEDSPGVLAAISRVFGDQKVSITSVQQFTTKATDAEIIIMTHRVKESRVQEAVKQIAELDVVTEVCSLIRAEL